MTRIETFRRPADLGALRMTALGLFGLRSMGATATATPAGSLLPITLEVR